MKEDPHITATRGTWSRRFAICLMYLTLSAAGNWGTARKWKIMYMKGSWLREREIACVSSKFSHFARLRLRGGMEAGLDNFNQSLSIASSAVNDADDAAPGGEQNVSVPIDDELHVIDEDDNSDALVDENGMPLNTNFTEMSDNCTSTGQRGCRHYSRGCKILAPCCNKYFWCRHCHNDAMDGEDPKKAHQLDRFAVKQVCCGECGAEQQVQEWCQECGCLFGRYFCAVCKFFDDDLSKGVFHCEGCGICRVGGRENFFHCSSCGCCYAVQLRSNHKCIAGAMHHNCPVCMENLFHSTSQVRVLRCGHTLHKKCLEQLLSRPTNMHTCPLCSKTIVDHKFTWHQLDQVVAETQMPEEYRNLTVDVLCNDCGVKGAVPFHVVGLKCPNPLCGGYNTRRA